MKPLHVALAYRPSWYRKMRIDGQFAYPVPEFTWEIHPVEKTFTFNLNKLKGVDLVWWDEGKHKGSGFLPAKGQRKIPVAYYCLYPTLAQHIFKDRAERARNQADLVLLEHDDLKRWRNAKVGCPVRRLAYSVNERYYYDRGLERKIDVGFYCYWGYSPERPAMYDWLRDFCKRKGYKFYAVGRWQGGVQERYAELLATTKVVVHLNRTPKTRPPRIFDCAASGAALLSNPMPPVNRETWLAWNQYVPFSAPYSAKVANKKQARREPYTDQECAQVIVGLEWLLDDGHWEEVAANAKEYVLKYHTWATRAKLLRQYIREEFGK